MKNLFVPDLTMLAGLVVGVFVIPLIVKSIHK